MKVRRVTWKSLLNLALLAVAAYTLIGLIAGIDLGSFRRALARCQLVVARRRGGHRSAASIWRRAEHDGLDPSAAAVRPDRGAAIRDVLREPRRAELGRPHRRDDSVLPTVRCAARGGSLGGRDRLAVGVRHPARALRSDVLHQRRRSRPVDGHRPAQGSRDHFSHRRLCVARGGSDRVRHPVGARSGVELAARGARCPSGVALAPKARAALRREPRRADPVRDHSRRMRSGLRVLRAAERAHPHQHGGVALRGVCYPYRAESAWPRRVCPSASLGLVSPQRRRSRSPSATGSPPSTCLRSGAS